MSGRIELLRLLADGALHSGEELAAKLSISRAAVWKRLRQFAGMGHRDRGASGKRLPARIADGPLDAAAIRALLPPAALEKLRVLDVHESLESTSDRLLAAGDLPPGASTPASRSSRARAAGRGRRWVAPFGSGLCLSMSWSYRDAPATLGALSLAAGVAALRALSRLGFRPCAQVAERHRA
jgi:BirA family biotin operon repressor/biotin-[acetyl-CoA-carboxylase] ligase